MRPRIGLEGTWERRLDARFYDTIPVPSSQRPLGRYELKRAFLLPRLTAGGRAFVHFEAILYHGRAFVNGSPLGSMGPYVPYEFDFTPHAREGTNEISVAIADLTPESDGAGREEIALGLNSGWEGGGGIIRDIWVEVRPSAFVDNTALAYTLNEDYSTASCRARVFVSAAASGRARVEVALWHGVSRVAGSARDVDLNAGQSEIEVPFEVGAPLLWSPRTPNLYRLAVRLQAEGAGDEWSCNTGFRDLRIRGRDFELNGTRLVLAGVCRHDMWKDQGFTLTRGQMQQDMRMIKAMGANFVRLAHYPHHRHIIELADQIGLLVTEEPGHWNVDFRKMPRRRIEVTQEIMERTIRRDWNSPSVFAWLLGNECTVTVDYLREGKDLCNRFDPIRRPVSFAHIYNEPKKTFDAGGLDFYTQHEYGFNAGKFRRAADEFGPDKPLVHTEWGWEVLSREQVVYERSFDRVLELVEEGKLAGHSFWSWQDIREYTRIDWPTQNGILLSGVVDEAREPRERLYLELARVFQRRRREEPPTRTRPELTPLRTLAWAPKARFTPIDLQKIADLEASRKAWSDLESRIAKYWDRPSGMTRGHWRRTGERFLLWQGGNLEIAGAPFRTPLTANHARPLVVTPESPELEVPIGLQCLRLHILGNVTLPSGFPVSGKAGEPAAVYTLRYSGGQSETVPIRNGIEIVRANLIHDATRIDPVATAAPRALTFLKDVAREHYQALLFAIPVRPRRIESLKVRLSPGGEPAAIFAITAEHSDRGARI